MVSVAPRESLFGLFPLKKPQPKSYIIAIINWRGAGKSLTETIIAEIMVYKMRKAGIDAYFYSNYPAIAADVYEPDIISLLQRALLSQPIMVRGKPSTLHPGWLALDESGSVAPRQRAISNTNLILSDFSEQIRKRGINILYTAQGTSRIDRHLWEQTDFAIDVKSSNNGRVLQLRTYDVWYRYRDDNREFREPGVWDPTTPELAKVTWNGCNNFWRRYDTDHIVTPSHLLEMQKKLARQAMAGTRQNQMVEKINNYQRSISTPKPDLRPKNGHYSSFGMIVEGARYDLIMAAAESEGVGLDEIRQKIDEAGLTLINKGTIGGGHPQVVLGKKNVAPKKGAVLV